MPNLEILTPEQGPLAIGPYSRMIKVGSMIWGSALAGVDPQTGQLVGPTVHLQTLAIIGLMKSMLESAGSDLDHVVSVTVFLKNMTDYEELNSAYIEGFGSHQPTRTVVSVTDVPKLYALLTMNFVAVTRE